jgi:glycosyltransferase involved in cell wall biosynthesis
MSHAPQVSVIIPCYNQGRYLDDAIASVLVQTYQNLEILVIDDGSTEPETIEVLQNYQQPKTRIIRTENQGVAAARNLGIAQAQGTYILPLDADDKIADSYLEKAVTLLESNQQLGIVYCEAEYFGDRQGTWPLPEYKFPDILVDNMIFCSGLFRKSDWETVGGYNSNLIYGWEDHDFWLSLIELGREVYRIPEVLFFYRQKADSMSRSMTAEHYIYSYTQLFYNHPQLYSQNIQAIFAALVTLKVDIFAQLEQARERIKQLEIHEQELQQDLQKNQLDYRERDEELQKAESKIAAMEKSKFWQMRRAWIKMQKLLGLLEKDPIYS